MPSIVTRVLKSTISAIGQNIAALSDKPPAFSDDDEHLEQRQAVRLTYKESGRPGSDYMQNICNALAMAEITENGGKWTPQPDVGPKACAEIEAIADIKFIFENENEKVIVIPNKNALAYALQDPPLKEGAYLRAFARENALEVKNEVAVRWDDTDADLGPHKEAVLELIQQAINERFKVLEPDDKLSVFFEQLGSYTCRQCG